MTNLVKVHPNERVDLEDFDFVSQSSVDDERRFNRDFFADPNAVIGGFFHTVSSATSLTITLGRAIASHAPPGGTPVQGQLMSEGVSSQVLSFSGLPVAEQTVWIRFFYQDGAQGNRIFWDTAAAKEATQIVDTRQIAGWNAVVSEVPPGADWFPIWQVSWTGNLATDAIYDRRRLVFEGDAGAAGASGQYTNGTYQTQTTDWNSPWGGGTDRSPDRGQFGITDFRNFVDMVRQKLTEIQTGDNSTDYPNFRFWEATPDSLDNKLSLSGNIGGKAISSIAFEDGERIFLPSSGDDFILGDSDLTGMGFAGISLAAGDLAMSSGDIALATGSLFLNGGGDLTLSGGGLLSTDGDVSLTAGDMLLTGVNSDVRITGGGAYIVEDRTTPGSAYLFARGDSPEIHLLNTAETNSRIVIADSGGVGIQYLTMEYNSGANLARFTCDNNIEWWRNGGRVMYMSATGLHPNSSKSHDLGSLAAPWGDSFFDTVDVDALLTMQAGSLVAGDLIPSNLTRDLGSIGAPWQNIRGDVVAAFSILGLSGAVVQGNVIPQGSNNADLGNNSGNEWRDLHMLGEQFLRRETLENNTSNDFFIKFVSSSSGGLTADMVNTVPTTTIGADRAVRVSVNGSTYWMRLYAVP